MPLRTYFLILDQSRPMSIIDINATTSNSLQFVPANFVREVSLGHKMHKRLPRDTSSVWKLNYVVLSQAGSFTDWHVDFSGTSVFYVLLVGEKDSFSWTRPASLARYWPDSKHLWNRYPGSSVAGAIFMDIDLLWKLDKAFLSQQERSTLCPQQRHWLWEQTFWLFMITVSISWSFQ